MATQAQRESFERVLIGSLGRAIEFLKFAETKNAALLTFSSAWSVAIVSLLFRPTAASSVRRIPLIDVGLGSALFFFALAIVVAVWSFLPKRKTEIFHRDPHQPKNLLFYGHIAEFGVSAFRSRAREQYLELGGPAITDKYLNDLSDQVAINSKIADRKFVLFNIGAMLALAALIAIFIPFALMALQVAASLIGASK